MKNKWSLFLYIIAFIIILASIFIVLVKDVALDVTLGRTLVSIALILVIIGKLLTVLEKRKANLRISADIGIVIGLLVVLVFRVF